MISPPEPIVDCCIRRDGEAAWARFRAEVEPWLDPLLGPVFDIMMARGDLTPTVTWSVHGNAGITADSDRDRWTTGGNYSHSNARMAWARAVRYAREAKVENATAYWPVAEYVVVPTVHLMGPPAWRMPVPR